MSKKPTGSSGEKKATKAGTVAQPFLTDVKTLRARARKNIDDGAVTLERNGRTSTLTLTYANTPVAPSAASTSRCSSPCSTRASADSASRSVSTARLRLARWRRTVRQPLNTLDRT